MTTRSKYVSFSALLAILTIFFFLYLPSNAQDLPVYTKSFREKQELVGYRVQNLIDVTQLTYGITNGTQMMRVDLSHITTLLDGTQINPRHIYGTLAIGPYPFEALESDFAYKRFRQGATVQNGRSILDVGVLFESKYNSEQWTNSGQIVVRLNLFLQTPEQDRYLGRYDIFTALRKKGNTYTKVPWIQEGPFVNRIDSRTPNQVTITLTTDETIDATILLEDGRQFTGQTAKNHEIIITDLSPATTYIYQVKVGDLVTRPYEFRTAPLPGQGKVTFAYCGDSREGVGGTRLHLAI